MFHSWDTKNCLQLILITESETETFSVKSNQFLWIFTSSCMYFLMYHVSLNMFFPTQTHTHNICPMINRKEIASVKNRALFIDDSKCQKTWAIYIFFFLLDVYMNLYSKSVCSPLTEIRNCYKMRWKNTFPFIFISKQKNILTC